jgi:putative transposase
MLTHQCLLSGKSSFAKPESGQGDTDGPGIKISMDGKGRCLDNVFVERLWRSVKYEEVYLKAYSNVLEAERSLGAYFRFYNEHRPHSSHNGRTPSEVYRNQPHPQDKQSQQAA